MKKSASVTAYDIFEHYWVPLGLTLFKRTRPFQRDELKTSEKWPGTIYRRCGPAGQPSRKPSSVGVTEMLGTTSTIQVAWEAPSLEEQAQFHITSIWKNTTLLLRKSDRLWKTAVAAMFSVPETNAHIEEPGNRVVRMYDLRKHPYSVCPRTFFLLGLTNQRKTPKNTIRLLVYLYPNLDGVEGSRAPALVVTPYSPLELYHFGQDESLRLHTNDEAEYLQTDPPHSSRFSMLVRWLLTDYLEADLQPNKEHAKEEKVSLPNNIFICGEWMVVPGIWEAV